MKSKIINRVRERQEDVWRYRCRVMAANIRLERERQEREALEMHDTEMAAIKLEYAKSSKEHAENHVRLLKAAMKPASKPQITKQDRQWWQFWK